MITIYTLSLFLAQITLLNSIVFCRILGKLCMRMNNIVGNGLMLSSRIRR